MKLTNETIEALSEKFARQFTFRMASSAHLFADLKQEAAIAIVLSAKRWRQDGGASIETFTRIYAWKAMQELCTFQCGPVGRPCGKGSFQGTAYGAPDHESASPTTPESILEMRQADEIVREFVARRAERFTGNGKLDTTSIKSVLHDLLRGDSCTEVAERHGCSKQRVSKLAAKAEIA